LVQKKCVQKVSDEGNFQVTTMETSPDGKFLATGSKTGVVNIYSIEGENGQISTEPLKSIFNLTTTINTLSFHPSSQMLLIATKWKKNQTKLLHLPSFTVYQNFPGVKNGNLKYTTCADFSSSGEFMTVGNDEGKAFLFHLAHFAS
jgi:U3 small nucleolar RNA-associated protein 18